jgi:hypothetical protein
MVQVEAKTLRICAKPCDAGLYTVLDAENKVIHEVDGYVPRWLGNDQCGDYIEMTIDLDTGQIIGWVTPTAAQLERWMDENP